MNTEENKEKEIEEIQEQEQQQTVDQPVSIEEQVANLSEEDMDKYDNFEDYVQASQKQEEVQPSEPEQTSDNATTQTVEQAQDNSGSEEPMSDVEFRQLVTSTLRANHKDFQIDDPNEIRKLMSFGLNYHKKMKEIAPHRRALKTLEQHGLLNGDKLNYAIELLEGNKGAIAKLLKEHSVDTYDLPDLEETTYQPQNYLPSEARLTFDEKVADLRESATGAKVVSFIKDLDSDSFYEIYNSPDMMDMLEQHVSSGLYDDAISFLEKERALGKVPSDVKDIDAYAFVADHLQKTNPAKYNPQQQPKSAVVVGNNLNQQQRVNAQQQQAKASASIPSNSGSRAPQQSYSGIDALLNASDEELSKYDNWEQYLASNNLNFAR